MSMSVKSANETIFNERSVIYTIQRNRICCSEQWKEIVRGNYRVRCGQMCVFANEYERSQLFCYFIECYLYFIIVRDNRWYTEKSYAIKYNV